MSAQTWFEHPNLPGQDIKRPTEMTGALVASGWRVRADQSDPPLDLPDDDPAPAPAAVASAGDEPAASTDPGGTAAPAKTTTKKGT